MLDHVGFQCADMAASAAFYDTVLAPLGLRRLSDHKVAMGYGGDFPDFWISELNSGEGFRESHIAFAAETRKNSASTELPARLAPASAPRPISVWRLFI